MSVTFRKYTGARFGPVVRCAIVAVERQRQDVGQVSASRHGRLERREWDLLADGHLPHRLLHPVRVYRTGPHWHIPGTPEKLKKESGDQGDRMMLWESTDNGKTFRKYRKHGNFGTYGEMYPRFLTLKDGRVLLTFTVRSNSTDGRGLGLRAILSDDDGEAWDFKHDRIVISDVNHGSSGGGFGNTVQLPDGALVSVYSYRGTDDNTHIEAVRWTLPKTK